MKLVRDVQLAARPMESSKIKKIIFQSGKQRRLLAPTEATIFTALLPRWEI